MNQIIQPGFGTRAYGVPTKTRETRQAGMPGRSFLDLVAKGSGTSGILGTKSTSEVGASKIDTYLEHLKSKYGKVTIESIGRDPESLEKAGKRMSGNDVVIAPNILEEMANDSQKAAHYEQKIDYFFTDVIPNGTAYAASIGLTFEPCGVVVHKEGTVTYLCGGGDSPERVAEVNRINREKDAKRAARQKQYQEQAVAAAAERRAMWERATQTEALEKSFSHIGDLLKTRMTSAPAVTPAVSLPAGTNLSFLNL